MQLEGVYTPCVTPFTSAGDLDLDALAGVIDFVLDGGVHGIVPCGTTGEYYALTFDERVEVMRTSQEVVAGRVPTIAGCNAGSTREVIRLSSAAAELGYDGVMLAVPATSLPTQEELVAHVSAVARAVGLPIVLYDFPARAGVQIGPEALDRLGDLPEVVAIKESSGDLSRFLALRTLLAGRIQLVCGADDHIVDHLRWGVRGWIAGTANVLPRHHAALVEAANAGDHETAQALLEGFLAWIQDMEAGGYNQKAKLGLDHQGVRVGPVRQPLLPVPPEEAARSLRLLDEALAAPPPTGVEVAR